LIAGEIKVRGVRLYMLWNCHGLRGSDLLTLTALTALRSMTQIFQFRLVLLDTPPPSSDS